MTDDMGHYTHAAALVPSDAVIEAVVRQALQEDLCPLSPVGLLDWTSGDITSAATLPRDSLGTATLLLKANGVVAGIRVAECVLRVVSDAYSSVNSSPCHIKWNVHDGMALSTGAILGTVHGPIVVLLVAERLLLNFMQRMSGIASLTKQCVDIVQSSHVLSQRQLCCSPQKVSRFRVLDTRKTVPCLRAFDKWAVRLGGGCNHRQGLWDMFLIKDNHIKAAGGIVAAVRACNDWCHLEKNHVFLMQQHEVTLKLLGENGITNVKKDDWLPPIEVEVSTLEECQAIADAYTSGYIRLHKVLLDNMVKVKSSTVDNQSVDVDVSMLRSAVSILQSQAPDIETEASGNVSLVTLPLIAATGVDGASLGALTHSVIALDISMKLT